MHEASEPDPSIFSEAAEVPLDERAAAAAGRNARYGLFLFAVYVLLYGGFIALAAFRHDLMARTLLGSVNVAICCGIGLIAAALLLALIYMLLCCTHPGTSRRTAP